MRLLFLVLAACSKGGGGGQGGPGGGGPDDNSGGGDETGDPEVPEVVVTACPDGGDYATAQAAIDAAPEGAVVELCDGTWTETLVVTDRTLILRGGTDAVMDGGGNVRLLEVTGGTVQVEGLTFTRGWSDRGGAITCTGGTLNLVDTVLSYNGAHDGGAIATTDCTVSLLRVQLDHNEAWAEGGGGIFEGGNVTVANSRIEANTGADGGGLLLRAAGGAVQDSEFVGNIGDRGGGIWFDGTVDFTGNTLWENHANYTGGGFAADAGTGDITDNEVYANTSDEDGGGAFTQHSQNWIAFNDFHDNVSQEDAGALRMLYGSATIEGNQFTSNTANKDGGAAKVSHAANVIADNTFDDNYSNSRGGALEIDDDTSTVSKCIFRGNEAHGDGGALHLNEPFWNLALSDLVFTDNVSGACGGAVAQDDDGVTESPEQRYTLTLTHVVASGNVALRGGGLCVLEGGLEVNNSIISANTADNGGAIYVDGADLKVTNAVLHGNEATSAGGMFVRSASRFLVTDSILSENLGGVATVAAASPTWEYTLHWGNSGSFSGMSDPTGSNGNFTADPELVDPVGGDFHLGATSPGVDAGSPTSVDVDGSRGDVGAYGGAFGDW